jgi:hypothetical protein
MKQARVSETSTLFVGLVRRAEKKRKKEKEKEL